MAGSMEVILTEDIPKLGSAGDVVRVRRGYGRNFLLPKGKAMLATGGRVKELEHQKRVVEEKQKKEMVVYQGMAEKIALVDLRFEAQASSEGRLFGSVTNADIAGRLAENGYGVDRRKIQLKAPIKQVGEHVASLRLHRDVIIDLLVNVVAAQVSEPAEQELGAGDAASADEAEPSEADEVSTDDEVEVSTKVDASTKVEGVE